MRLSKALLIGFMLMALPAVLPTLVPSNFALAQDGITPPPPRPRRAYSTFDAYHIGHGVSPDQLDALRKPPRRAKRIPRRNKADVDALGDNVRFRRPESEGADELIGKPAGINTLREEKSTAVSAVENAPARSVDESAGGAAESGKPGKLMITPPDPESLEVPASSYTSIPSVQMPQPPTSIGGLAD